MASRTGRVPITHGKSQPTKLAISSSGQRIAVAWTDGGGITVYDTASAALLDTFKDSPFDLRPDGRWLARHGKLRNRSGAGRIGRKSRS